MPRFAGRVRRVSWVCSSVTRIPELSMRLLREMTDPATFSRRGTRNPWNFLGLHPVLPESGDDPKTIRTRDRYGLRRQLQETLDSGIHQNRSLSGRNSDKAPGANPFPETY